MPQSPSGPQNPYEQQFPQGPYAPGPYGRQQPYGAPPVPPQQQPYGWGVPFVGPPPKRRRVGLILGIVGGVGGVLAVSVAALIMYGSKLTDIGLPEAEYRLSLPKTLVDDRYELVEAISDSEGRKVKDETGGGWDAKVAGVAGGQYSPGGDEEKGTLVVIGLYGRFRDPDWSRHDMMKGAGHGAGEKVAVAPKGIHPAGSGEITITCEITTHKNKSLKVTVSICGWVDANTLGSVAEASTTEDPSDVDLDKLAATTLRIRSEMRRPI